MTKLTNPIPIFLDGRGTLVDAGYIYVGVANADPEVSPIDVFWDAALTVPALQPLRTLGGVIVNGMNNAFAFFAEADYSLTIRDANGVLVAYIPSSVDVDPATFQPLNGDLTTISGQSNTPFGLALLTLPDSAGLKAATGIPDSLPLTGGTMSENIVRSGAGVHSYALNPLFTGYRLCGCNPIGTADATSQPGDYQVFY